MRLHCCARQLLFCCLMVIAGMSIANAVMTDTFVRRAAPDRSVSAEVPENWFYWAHSGNFEALAPLGRAGVVFKAFPVSARSDTFEAGSRPLISPYRPPQAFVHDVLAQYRFRSVRVLGWQPDEDAARRCAQLLRRECEAAEVVARWTSAEGAECVGAFKIVNATPTSGGQWFSIVAGSWGSAMAIAADRPAIERATRSIQAADGIARSYLLDMLVQIRMLAGNRTYNYKLSESQLEALNR